MTTRLAVIDPAGAAGKVKDLLDAVQKNLGVTPNMVRTMAQSPAALEGYLAFSGALGGPGAALGLKAREELALALARANRCNYCASAHTALGKMAGLTSDQAAAALRGKGTDPRTSAAIRLAEQIVETRGDVSDAGLTAARAGGLGDADIAEVVAHVALNIYTNYLNRLARTEIDFPKVVVTGPR